MDEPEKVNILLVDDEPKNLAAFEAVLESSDRTVVTARSGEEALRHLLKTEFAVILLDIRMPGMDGFETAELIRERRKSRGTPIIFLTAFNQGDTQVSRGYSIGAVDYIFKPVDPVILKSKVAAFVELYKKTEQVKRQAEQLAETTAFLNNVLESSTEYAIIALDLSKLILTWNEGARRTYGYTAEEMVGQQHASILYTPEDLAAGRIDALFDLTRPTNKSENLFEGVRNNSQRFPASVAVTLRQDGEGAPAGYVLMAKDITERKQAEEAQAQKAANEQLKRVDKIKSEFVSFVSHEFRGSLSAIMGYSDMISTRDLSLDKIKKYAENISKSGQRLNRMITEMLDLDRLESGEIKLNLATINLNEIVAEAVNVITPTAPTHTITLQLDPEIPPLSGDPDKLSQVVTNLMSNAIKYSPQGGAIQVSSRATADGAHVSVTDQGIGLPPEALEQAFERYTRFQSAASQGIAGTGLGLPIVRQIVTLHGGNVWAESTLNQGSAFHFTLPYSRGAPSM